MCSLEFLSMLLAYILKKYINSIDKNGKKKSTSRKQTTEPNHISSEYYNHAESIKKKELI